MRINHDKPFTEREESVMNELPSFLLKELYEFLITPNMTINYLESESLLNILTYKSTKGGMT